MTQALAQSAMIDCWACSAPNAQDAHFCVACGKLLSSNSTDYFVLLALPRHLTLDVKALEKQFYRLSRKLHPDHFVQASEREQQQSLEKSSLLNDAYRTLRDPIARTEYLLESEGVRLEEQSRDATDLARATGNAKQQVVPADLLEDVFELNMQLEEARQAAASNSQDPELVANLEAAERSFTVQMEALRQQLELLWAAWDVAFDSYDLKAKDAAKDAMVALLNRRSYIRNLVRDVQQALGR